MRVRIEPDALGLVDKLNAARPGRGPLSGTPRAHQLMSQAAAATRPTCKRNSERRDVNSVHVFVAGASGVPGRRLVPHLIARGPRVTATTTRAGPEPQDFVDMARRILALGHDRTRLVPSWRDGPFGVEAAGEVLLPAPSARLGATTFDSWLARRRTSTSTCSTGNDRAPSNASPPRNAP